MKLTTKQQEILNGWKEEIAYKKQFNTAQDYLKALQLKAIEKHLKEKAELEQRDHENLDKWSAWILEAIEERHREEFHIKYHTEQWELAQSNRIKHMCNNSHTLRSMEAKGAIKIVVDGKDSFDIIEII